MARVIRLATLTLSGPEGEMDLPPPSPETSASENAAFRARVEKLIYGPENSTGIRSSQPPLNQAHANSHIANGALAAAEETAFFPVRQGNVLTQPSIASVKAFDEINSTWRKLEAWAGIGLGAEIGYGPFKKNSIAPTYRNWLQFSRAWKSGEKQDTTALESIALDLQKAEKVASEYGYPGIYHPDRREEKDATVDHYVHVPGVEDQSLGLGLANTVSKNMPKLPDGPGDLFGPVPLWAKIAVGVAVAGIVASPIVALVTRPRSS